jgi:hypothetical protein
MRYSGRGESGLAVRMIVWSRPGPGAETRLLTVAKARRIAHEGAADRGEYREAAGAIEEAHRVARTHVFLKL